MLYCSVRVCCVLCCVVIYTCIYSTHPVALGFSKCRPHLLVRFEELVGEVLGEKSKHQAGTLGVGDKFPPDQELLSQHLSIR